MSFDLDLILKAYLTMIFRHCRTELKSVVILSQLHDHCEVVCIGHLVVIRWEVLVKESFHRRRTFVRFSVLVPSVAVRLDE